MLTAPISLYLLLSLVNSVILWLLMRLSRKGLGCLFTYPIFFHLGINYVGVTSVILTQNNITKIGVEFNSQLVNSLSIEFSVSWLILLILITLTFGFERGKFRVESHLDYFRSIAAETNNKRLFYIAIFLLLFDTFYYGIPPGLVLVTKGVSEALQTKGVILISKMESGIPLIGYLVRYLPMIALVHSLLYFIFSGKRNKIHLYLLLTFAIYSVLSLIKSYLILPVGFLVFLLFTLGRVYQPRKQKILISFLLFCCILPFTLLSGDDVLQSMLARLLFIQHEGMFLIRDLYDQPSVQFFLYSSPLRHLTGSTTIDPAAAVVEHYFGRDTGWVNVNSFYSGQGYTMFGNGYIIIIPLIYCISLVLSFNFSKLFLSRSMSIIVVGAVNLFVPLSNNIANLVWGKEFFAVLIISIFLRIFLRQAPNVKDRKL